MKGWETGAKKMVKGSITLDEYLAVKKKLDDKIEKLDFDLHLMKIGLSDRDLTLVTLCDMVLGEDAEDRSDDALIRAVGELVRSQIPSELKGASRKAIIEPVCKYCAGLGRLQNATIYYDCPYCDADGRIY